MVGDHGRADSRRRYDVVVLGSGHEDDGVRGGWEWCPPLLRRVLLVLGTDTGTKERRDRAPTPTVPVPTTGVSRRHLEWDMAHDTIQQG